MIRAITDTPRVSAVGLVMVIPISYGPDHVSATHKSDTPLSSTAIQPGYNRPTWKHSVQSKNPADSTSEWTD